MKLWIIALALLVVACSGLRPRTVSNVAHDMCVAVFSERPEIVAQAKVEKLSPFDVAKAVCATNDIVRPFLLAGRDAGDEAMGQAHKLGLVRER